MSHNRLSDATVARIRELRYQDGLSCTKVAAIVGCSASTVRDRAPGHIGKVPTGPVREVFLASGRAASSVAVEIGWFSPQDTGRKKGRTGGDGSRVRRALGIKPDVNRNTLSHRKLVDAEIAGLIAEACGQPAWSVMPDGDAEPIAAFDPTPHLR